MSWKHGAQLIDFNCVKYFSFFCSSVVMEFSFVRLNLIDQRDGSWSPSSRGIRRINGGQGESGYGYAL